MYFLFYYEGLVDISLVTVDINVYFYGTFSGCLGTHGYTSCST